MGDKKTQASDLKNFQTGLSIYLLVAIAAAIFGIAIVFSNRRWKQVAGMYAGILCCVMMLALMIHLTITFKNALASSPSKLNSATDLSGVIKMQFTFWYFLSIATFAAAAFLSYKHYQLGLRDAEEAMQQFEFQQNIPGTLGTREE